MFIKQYKKELENPKPRNKWKYKQMAVFSCDYCEEIFETSKNIKRKISKKLHFCGKKCSGKAKKKNGISYKESSKRMLEKYGVAHACSRPTVAKKRKETIEKLYGVDNASKLEWVKEKKKLTSYKNYGVDHPLKSDIVKEKKKQTSMEKYGFEFASQSPKVKAKAEATCMERYGERNFCLSEEYIESFSSKTNANFQNITGKFIILGKEYYYRSSYELIVFNEIKKEENKIKHFETNYVIPYTYKNKKYKYLADFYIEYNGKTYIIETKNKFLLSKEKTKEKIKAAINLCENNKWKFILLDNNSIKDFNITSLNIS